MQKKIQYFDNIGNQYEKTDTGLMLIRRYSEVYTLFSLLGDISGKSALDLACSDGFFTRQLKHNGTSRTVGVDISDKMIEIAREEEQDRSMGIEYIISDVNDLGAIGEFDIIFTPFLLNYAYSKEELRKMCEVIYANLKPNGVLLNLNNHPDLLPKHGDAFRKYGLSKKYAEPLQDGTLLTISLIMNDDECSEDISFQSNYYSKTTLEWALREAGFQNINWHQPQISPEGIEKCGLEFWEDFLEYPSNVFIECFK